VAERALLGLVWWIRVRHLVVCIRFSVVFRVLGTKYFLSRLLPCLGISVLFSIYKLVFWPLSGTLQAVCRCERSKTQIWYYTLFTSDRSTIICAVYLENIGYPAEPLLCIEPFLRYVDFLVESRIFLYRKSATCVCGHQNFRTRLVHREFGRYWRYWHFKCFNTMPYRYGRTDGEIDVMHAHCALHIVR